MRSTFTFITRRWRAGLFSVFILNGLVASAPAQPLAFPGAEGFGRFAEGGRGGDVYTVTNLDDAGPGSLRDGIRTATGPRTIVFAISGTITLHSKLTIDRSHLTIAGQTAPGDGVTVRDYPLQVAADHVVLRYVRSRLGPHAGKAEDAISVLRGRNVIIDHCSASWSVDETLSAQGDDIDLLTVQWCIVSESLDNSVHPSGRHGMGGIIGGVRQTYHHNLFAHHATRNPKISWRRYCQVDFRNNVIFNWGRQSCYDAAFAHANWTHNYYLPGPATEAKVRSRIFQVLNRAPVADQPNASLFIDSNVVVGNPVVSADNWAGGVDFGDGATAENSRAATPFDYPLLTYFTDATTAYHDVLAGVGAAVARDSVDTRIIDEARHARATFGKHGIIDHPDEVGGWPELSSKPAPTDSDGDGMPDTWEIARGLNPTDPADRNYDPDGDGYTNLEDYLNSLARPGFPEAMKF
jgi:pectate lyase